MAATSKILKSYGKLIEKGVKAIGQLQRPISVNTIINYKDQNVK